MVKKMIVVLSALALIMTTVGVACAFMPYAVGEGDMIMIPMKVKSTYKKVTGPGAFSALFAGRGCPQYSNGFFPWGTWKAVKCTYRTQIIPPKCVAPAYGGPMAWGAPTPVMPGCKLVKSVEKFGIQSPGCNPCVEGGLQYQIVKKQVVK
jgi:hypothetical protein